MLIILDYPNTTENQCIFKPRRKGKNLEEERRRPKKIPCETQSRSRLRYQDTRIMAPWFSFFPVPHQGCSSVEVNPLAGRNRAPFPQFSTQALAMTPTLISLPQTDHQLQSSQAGEGGKGEREKRNPSLYFMLSRRLCLEPWNNRTTNRCSFRILMLPLFTAQHLSFLFSSACLALQRRDSGFISRWGQNSEEWSYNPFSSF